MRNMLKKSLLTLTSLWTCLALACDPVSYSLKDYVRHIFKSPKPHIAKIKVIDIKREASFLEYRVELVRSFAGDFPNNFKVYFYPNDCFSTSGLEKGKEAIRAFTYRNREKKYFVQVPVFSERQSLNQIELAIEAYQKSR